MAGQVNMNPAFSPYAVDDPDLPDLSEPYGKGLDNHAYENCTTDKADPSHHYENPGNLTTNGTGRKKKASPIYESADPFPTSTKYHEEPPQPYKESRLGFVLLFIILVISIVALVLVILIIIGKLGPSCSCNNTGKLFLGLVSVYS